VRFSRSSGILLHPTSLPGAYGSGDLGAASYHFVDWLVSAGQTMWQMLPLGNIGPGNSPYMSSSAFAGNLLMIDLDELKELGWLNEDELLPLVDFKTDKVNFELSKRYRLEKLKLAAGRFFLTPQHQQQEFLEFCAEEKAWLDDYVLFMVLCDQFSGLEWGHWPAKFSNRDENALSEVRISLSEQIAFWQFTQWCFFRQWRRLKHYANTRGISLIGDLPIFVSYQSADVWSRQTLFKLGADHMPTVIAGVPPDYFSVTGQRWGNPLFCWETHAKDNYAWWIARMKKTSEMYDIVRIDHFRGFAEYWEIPASEPTAINGKWIEGPGEKLFTAIQQALGPLQVIAEDLGIITPDVTELLEKFNLPGMRVLQFAFGGGPDNRYLPHHFINNMVVYVGTHDNDTAVGWFESAPVHDRAFVCRYLRTDGNEINWALLHAASQSVADVAIYTMQDVLGLGNTGRMNLPGVADNNWAWRFEWAQVSNQNTSKLYEMSALHGRCRADRLNFSR
jgi:4-alpha-glucanotransferase